MKIDEAFAAIFGPVPKSYSKAIQNRWKALQNQTEEERKLNGTVKPAEHCIRDYISDHLLTRKNRRLYPKWWISWDSTRFHYVNFDRSGGKPEMVGPRVSFSLYTGRGERIKIDSTLRDKEHLDGILERVLAMAKGAE